MSGPTASRAGVLLAIDAAPGVGSVAVVRDGRLVDARAVAMRAPANSADRGASATHDDPLMVAIADVLRDLPLSPRALRAVACGAGPGGFTSLRIAAAIGKGLAHAAGCAFLAAPSLAWAAAARAPEPGVWLVTLDALRGERYIARVAVDGDGARAAHDARSVTAYEFLGVHADQMVALLAAEHRAHGVLEIDASVDGPPIATGVVALPPSPVDLAAWQPAYGRLAEAQVRWEAEHGPLRAVATAGEA